MTQSMKRIHKVVIRHLADDDYPECEQTATTFIGIMAEAEVQLRLDNPSDDKGSFIVQRITSGGLWGIESNSEPAYLAEIETEQLAELREQLHAAGFSERAISAAYKNVVSRA